MAWKTGRNVSLSSSGPVTGHIHADASDPGAIIALGPPPPAGGPGTTAPPDTSALNGSAAVTWSVGGPGGSCQGSATVSKYAGVADGMGGYTGTRGVSQVTVGCGAAGYDGPHTPTGGGVVNGAATDLDCGGSYSMSIDCEEWVDFLDDGMDDPTDGVFWVPFRGRLRYYLLPRPGGQASVSCSFAGYGATDTATLTATDAARAGDGLNNTVGAALTGDCVYGSFSLASHWTALPTDVQCASDGVTSSAGGSASSSGGAGGASISGSAATTYDAGSGHGLGASVTTQTAHADCHVTAAPYKSFNLTGRVYAVSDDYPAGVSVNCQRFPADPAANLTASPSWSVSYDQALYSITVNTNAATGTRGGPSDGAGSSDPQGHSQGKNEWAAAGAVVNTDWALANGEYQVWVEEVDSDSDDPDAPPTFVDHYLYDTAIYLHGPDVGTVTLTQDASLVVNACTSAAGWAGAVAGGGGLQSASGATAMSLAFSPLFNFSGYRYLKLSGLKVSSGTATGVKLQVGSGTYTLPTLTTTATDYTVDLLNPDGAAAGATALDTKWPFDDHGRDNTYAPGWGVSCAAALSLSGLDGARTYTLGGVTQTRTAAPVGHWLSEHCPKADGGLPEEEPPVSSGTGGDAVTATAYAHRGLVCDTDGRQSLEIEDAYLLHYESDSGADGWSVQPWSLQHLVDTVNAGDQFGATALPSGSLGWHATTAAPAGDGSVNMYPGWLNRDTGYGAAWLCYGVNASGGTLSPTCGNSPTLTAKASVMATSVDFWAGCGDVLGRAPAGASNPHQAIYIVCSKVYRAQTHGVVLYQDGTGAANAKGVSLSPDGTGLQPAGAAVGAATTDAQGRFVTSGAGLTGWTTTGTAPHLATNGSGASVTDMTDG